MDKLFVVALATCIVLPVWTPSVLAADAKARPVEFRACNFQDGKGFEDLEKVSAKFREYANKNDSGYAAWILAPEFHNDDNMDVGWLGAWPNGEAYGVSMEKWKSPGNGLLRQFQEVIECENHVMMASHPINAPSGTPEDGILLAYDCNLHEGKTIKDAYEAHLDFGQTMKSKGSQSVSWMYTPLAGFGNAEVDYYHIVGFYRYSDLGQTMEMFVNGGGVATRQKIIDPVASCNTPTVYDAVSVRARDER